MHEILVSIMNLGCHNDKEMEIVFQVGSFKQVGRVAREKSTLIPYLKQFHYILSTRRGFKNIKNYLNPKNYTSVVLLKSQRGGGN